MVQGNTSECSEKTSESAYAYTPGLKIKQCMKVIKERRLPIEGEVLVKNGDFVSYKSVVAKTTLLGDPVFVKGSQLLGVEPGELLRYTVKKENDVVKENEVLAKYEALFGLIKKQVCSPIEGVIESISGLTGQIIVRGAPKPVMIDAYIPGKIVEVKPREGVTIETNACFVQGIFGIGGENHGMLKVLVESADEILEADAISEEDEGCVLVGGSNVTLEAMQKAVEVGATGVVVGGIEQSCLTEFMGREIGVAITGEEDTTISLIVTEGFGKMAMSQNSFNLMKRFEGQMACINGATQIRAGVLRPEIIIPHEEETGPILEMEMSSGIVSGTSVRIIAEPYFGAIGKVTNLPIDLRKIQTESSVRVLNVELEDGNVVQVPRANVEILEE